MDQTKVYLNDSEFPRKWYNLAADMPRGFWPPLAHDRQLIQQRLEAVFPKNLIEQEMSTRCWIDIPREIASLLYRFRPSPLCRAVELEQFLKTPAKIYYKDEGASPAGSHKINTALAQAWYNKKAGVKRLTTETGAGQWGTALSFACYLMGLECKIYMVRASLQQKPMRKIMMNMWQGQCVASPSGQTRFGRKIKSIMPKTTGSLAIAMSEAIEEVLSDQTGKTRYAIGSVLNHVLLHQTIIGLEAKVQLKKIGIAKPDIVIASIGGGSNFAGIAFPFVYEKINGAKIEIIPVEPDTCPKMTKGQLAWDHFDAGGQMPLLPMYTLGHDFIPPDIYAGGLRYHGLAPLVSQALAAGLLRPHTVDQKRSYESAILWARTEGAIVAPEASYALACVIREALNARKEGREKVILFNLSGHGLLDLAGYEKYLSGKLKNPQVSDISIRRSLHALKI